jgi:hypothetical protein
VGRAGDDQRRGFRLTSSRPPIPPPRASGTTPRPPQLDFFCGTPSTSS